MSIIGVKATLSLTLLTQGGGWVRRTAAQILSTGTRLRWMLIFTIRMLHPLHNRLIRPFWNMAYYAKEEIKLPSKLLRSQQSGTQAIQVSHSFNFSRRSEFATKGMFQAIIWLFEMSSFTFQSVKLKDHRHHDTCYWIGQWNTGRQQQDSSRQLIEHRDRKRTKYNPTMGQNRAPENKLVATYKQNVR